MTQGEYNRIEKGLTIEGLVEVRDGTQEETQDPHRQLELRSDPLPKCSHRLIAAFHATLR